ncbi:MAG TPA: asparagine synthase, partial [Cytophagales bacterium]|nr:asparagine synthase [Cytophagales bacterium]
MQDFSNQTIRLPIAPSVVSYYKLPTESKLDYPAICCFVALGFFLDDDTYYTNLKAFRPATDYHFSATGEVLSRKRYFDWHYTPRSVSFKQALNEFSNLLEQIIERETANKKIVLPISGGLDSRTLAGAVAHRSDVFGYSYQFENGVNENFYGAAVARALSFPYYGYTLSKGYLWKVIDQLAQLNGCYAEFLNPRQMAIYGQLANKGDVFLLGHGGDLFFDSMGVPDSFTEGEQHQYLVQKLIKSAGWQLGQLLWEAWGISGDFREYLEDRILFMLRNIQIDNANARLRAFKTEYYVARWTAVNLEIFKRQLPISIPFFDDEMCRFICTVPEEHLVGRKLEIEYLKLKSPSLAKIPWQNYYPCNLYNYEKFNSLSNVAKRAMIKGQRELKKYVLGKRSDTRNWELQFLGKFNDEMLRFYLLDKSFENFLPLSLVKRFYEKFKKNP